MKRALLGRVVRQMALGVVVLVVIPVTAAHAASPLSWSPPAPFDFANGQLNAVSCPSASLCAGVDQNGNVVTSTNPTAARRRGLPPAWTAAMAT